MDKSSRRSALGKKRVEAKAAAKPAPSFHPPSNIPQAPKPYIAHPYVLLQTKSVIGRQEELNELTDWITKNEQVPEDTRIFSVVAIGGMGKSALTWKWFEDIAPNELPNLAGRMWWSFYESDAHWENFIIRALAYAAGMPEAEVRQLPPPEREDRLLRLLDERPFLLVLDGLERILLAYARMDAAHLPDDDLDQQTANAVAGATGLPDDVRETYLEKHRLRQCADLRAGAFLRKLARVRASRVLLSTRLYPAELQTQTAQPLPGCHALFLRGLDRRRRARALARLHRRRTQRHQRAVAPALPGLWQLPAPAPRPRRRGGAIPSRPWRFRPLAQGPSRLQPRRVCR